MMIFVRITEKLRRLTEDKNKAEVARKAGLKATMISDYISKEYVPRADIALKMARALQVPLEWLVDDAQDWPPPKPKEQPSVRDIADSELLREVATRERHAILEFYEAAEGAESIDWKRATEELESLQAADPLPDRVQQAIMALLSVQAKFSRVTMDFSVHFFSTLNHESLPGSDRSIDDMQAGPAFALGRLDNREDVKHFHELVKNRPEWIESPWRWRLMEYHSLEYEHFRRIAGPARYTKPEEKDRLPENPSK